MTADESKLFLRRFVEQVWQHDNPTAIGQYIATRCIYHDSALGRDLCGPVELTHYIQELRAAVRNWHFHVAEVVSAGNTIAVRWDIEGTHDRPLPQLPPTGKPVQLIGITMYRLTGNTVTEAWSCWNAKAVQLMRTVYCACGTRLEAPDDTALFQQYRSHVDAAHADWSYSDEQIRSVILGCAHDRHASAVEALREQEYGGHETVRPEVDAATGAPKRQ
jgi:predicted ester cyclase